MLQFGIVGSLLIPVVGVVPCPKPVRVRVELRKERIELA